MADVGDHGALARGIIGIVAGREPDGVVGI